MTLATQVGAKEPEFVGSKAVDLVLKAQKKGLIIYKNANIDNQFFTLLLDGKYYNCFFKANKQSCSNFTGYKKN